MIKIVGQNSFLVEIKNSLKKDWEIILKGNLLSNVSWKNLNDKLGTMIVHKLILFWFYVRDGLLNSDFNKKNEEILKIEQYIDVESSRYKLLLKKFENFQIL